LKKFESLSGMDRKTIGDIGAWRRQGRQGMVEAKIRDNGQSATEPKRRTTTRPTPPQRAWLRRALDEPGGKLPLFDPNGRRVNERTIRSCIDQGWAQPWFDNPIKPDWLVCKITEAGRRVVE
jgi:hypothetical protein